MRRHTESYDVLILAVLLKMRRVVALMSVNDEQAVCANAIVLGVLVKMLNPI